MKVHPAPGREPAAQKEEEGEPRTGLTQSVRSTVGPAESTGPPGPDLLAKFGRLPKANILVVDDEPMNLYAFVEILGELGENVVQASSGEEALRWLLRQDFAAVLLDVRMSGMDGYETARLIRQREKLRHLPIIFMTAVNKDEDQVVRGYALGAVDYVFKPVSPVVLRSKVSVFVELYKKTEEVRRQAELERELQLENLRVRAEKMEAEQALRRVEEHQALIIRSLPVALYTAELDARFSGPRYLSESVADLVGFEPDAFVKSSGLWVERIHPGDRSRVLDEVTAAAETGSLETEYRWCCADGGERYFLDRGVVVRQGVDTAGEIVGTCLDVTDRKHMEQQLFHAQKMEAVGQLTGGMAHDFNNMLTVVIGNLDMLTRGLRTTGGKNHDRAQMALLGAQSCAELTRRLLAFASRQPLRPEPINLSETIPGMAKLLQQSLGENIEIEFRLASDLWSVLVDPAQVESAIVNLSINARDAMPDGGRLIIEAGNVVLDEDYVAALNREAKPGEFVMLAVGDTGSGMTPEVMQRALEPFFTTKPTGRGTGLGLSMVYGFVRQSGGHVQIESEVDRGTTVRLYLPRTNVSATAAPGPGAGSPLNSGAGRTILVVEDDAGVRAVTVSQLEEQGYTVLQAENGPAALHVLRHREPVDLLFTDIVMPGGVSGLDLAREAVKLRPGLKVLYTTGYSSEIGTSGDSLGELLPKPYREEELVRKLHRVFA